MEMHTEGVFQTCVESPLPKSQYLGLEVSHHVSTCWGYGRLRFPLAELSLEGNPIEAPVVAAIANALQQLSPPAGYMAYTGEPEPPVGEPPTVPTFLAETLRRTQSQPNLQTTIPEISERKALSEADIESEGELPDRSETIQEFQEATAYTAFLVTEWCLSVLFPQAES